MLLPGWYIILYHDISWEENCYVRSIGGTIPPDVFRQHVQALASLGHLVSIEDGERRLRDHALDAPTFSFWFDDGMTGVARYAMPILEEAGVTGAVSVCSRFMNRTELFWRFKLSYLNSIDGMRLVRSRLQRHGLNAGDSIRMFTWRHFSGEILDAIDELFNRLTTPAQREDAYRLFLDREAIATMGQRGWTVANHTAAHYAVEMRGSPTLAEQFEECEQEIVALCRRPSRYWTLPFGASNAREVISAADPLRSNRYLVFVGERVNTSVACLDARVLFRICAPAGSSQELIRRLEAAQRQPAAAF